MPRLAGNLIFILTIGAGLPAAAQQPAPSGALIVRPEDRPPVSGGMSACGSIRYLVNSEDTGGAFSIVESNSCGRPMTGVHRHRDMDEAFYVVEGTLTVYADGKTHTLGPGSYFFVPRGTWHAQGNPCNIPNKVLVTFTPGGFERFLRNRSEVLKTTTLGSPEYQAAMKARGTPHGTGPGGGSGANNLGVGEVPCP